MYVGARVRPKHAAFKKRPSFEGLRDSADRGAIGREREAVTALPAAVATHDAGSAQSLQDLRKKCWRDVDAVGKFGRADDGTARTAAEIGQRGQRDVRLLG